MDSAELFQRSQKVAPGGVHSPVRSFRSVGGTPIFFKASEGAYLTSVEGKRYLDFCMSFGPMILGHRDPEVVKAVHEVVDTAWALGTCEPYSLELSEWLIDRLPFVDKLRFVSSGTEAVMSAIRVARAANQRSLILKFDGCYHGHSDGLLVKSGSGLAGLASSDSAGVTETVARETLVCSLDDDAQLEQIFSLHGSQIAAAILEPLPANYGLLLQRPEFLHRLQALCRQHGSLLILDEVITGFRMGLQGMAGLLKLDPDLVCYGKIVGGGFNVAAYGGKERWMNLVAPMGPVYQAGTLSANPVGMVAGLATLQRMEKLNVWSELESRGAKMQADFTAQMQAADLPFQMVRAGSLFWILPNSDGPVRCLSKIPKGLAETYKVFFHRMLEKGIYLAPSGYEVNFLSMAHTPELLDSTVRAMMASLKESVPG